MARTLTGNKFEKLNSDSEIGSLADLGSSGKIRNHTCRQSLYVMLLAVSVQSFLCVEQLEHVP